jgi:hypothetical protein
MYDLLGKFAFTIKYKRYTVCFLYWPL